MVEEEYYEEDEFYEEDEEFYDEDADFVDEADYLPPEPAKPKSDVWTLLLVLGFLFMLSALVIMVVEMNEVYQISPEKIPLKLFG